MDNLEEMGKFLERYNLPKVNHEEIEYMDLPIVSYEIEIVFKIFPQTKSQIKWHKFYQIFREK